MDVGLIEKCLTELKMPNVLPGEREEVKSQVKKNAYRSTIVRIFFFPCKIVLVQCSDSLSAALGVFRAPLNFILREIIQQETLFFVLFLLFSDVSNNVLFFIVFSVGDCTSVPVWIFQTPAVVHPRRQRTDWSDGLHETAVVYSSGCSYAGH